MAEFGAISKGAPPFVDTPNPPVYTDIQVRQIATAAAEQAVSCVLAAGSPIWNLENGIPQATEITPSSEGHDMAKRIRQRLTINGETKWVTGATMQEVFEAAAALMNEGTTAKKKQAPLFKDYAQKWYTLYKIPSVQATTVNTYNAQLQNHILPFFGEMRLDEITTDDVQRFFLTKAGMSASYSRQIRGLLHDIFEAAIEDKLMTENPEHSRRITMPKRAKERKALELEEVQDVLAHFATLDTTEQMMLAIWLYTGVRRGELLGLRWEDISFEHKSVHVSRQVVYGNGNQPIVKEPKSRAGVRYIGLTPELEAILLPNQSSGFIFHAEGDADKPLTLQVYRKLWKQLTAKVNVHGATPHCLRHTFVTMSVERTDIKTLQEMAGHSDCDITLNRYAHARKDKILKAAHDLSGMYGDVTNRVTDTSASKPA